MKPKTEAKTTGLTRVSNSRLGMLSRCGEQYRRRYVEREKIPPAVAMLVGRAVDRSVTKNLEQKMKGGGLKPREEVEAIARDAVAKEMHGEFSLTEEEAALGVAAVKGQAADKTVRLAALHAKELAPGIEPTHLQRWLSVDMTGVGYPAELVGVIDVQERGAIRDTKTSKNSPSKGTADESQQLTTYALASRVVDGEIPELLTLDFLVDLKKPKIVVQESRRTEEHFGPLLARIERFLTVVEAGAFQPADPKEWWCGPTWCGYWSSCPFAARPVSIVVP